MDIKNRHRHLNNAFSILEDFRPEDYGIYDNYEGEVDNSLTEDLTTSYPVKKMSEEQIRSAAKNIVKGAKVRFGYVNSIPLTANYAQGKFVKKENKQYPVVKAIHVTECRACTGVKYENTEGAELLHSTQKYQDKLAARKAAGLGGFGTNIHDTEAGLENILVTTPNGKKCIVAYPMSNGRPDNTYYISVDGEDWRQTNKQEIAQYMTPADAAKFLGGNTDKATYQSNVRNDAGQNTVASGFNVIDLDTGKKLKVMTHPFNITYFDPVDPYKCVYALDKESAVVVETPEISAETQPLNQDFPDVE